jgi:hypothetical protein
MPRDRTPLEKAAGKLISAIQREWIEELSDPQAHGSEEVMHASHSLLQAASASGPIGGVIGQGSVAAFLGQAWVDANPSVLPSVRALESAESDASK